ncbi:hypothetical protein U9M48_005814 [Paspalum notatum var. saurae]|uniref:RING-type domain-containing protein n=1 Tax=Paspalum notatum var. saurae TaxID=547442 RepID=A0AAQ3PWH7_PASNO
MPSPYRAGLHPVDFFEIDLDSDQKYQEEEDDDQGSEKQEGDDTQGSREDDEEEVDGPEREDSAVRDSGPSAPAPARVSEVAAAGGWSKRATAPICPACMEPWTSQGAHRICCIPCGHVYGRSCLERCLTLFGSHSAMCRQCAKGFKHEDIINLDAPQLVTPHSELEKEISYLREENDLLEKKVNEFFEELRNNIKRIEEMNKAASGQASGSGGVKIITP